MDPIRFRAERLAAFNFILLAKLRDCLLVHADSRRSAKPTLRAPVSQPKPRLVIRLVWRNIKNTSEKAKSIAAAPTDAMNITFEKLCVVRKILTYLHVW
jgi:hypothetical protein